ncbi:hypothetical protein [Streptomyces cylindrosporus]|uniref:Uncharacterized protein n=1 Tax=Streptomyces cylindrosporus TaxID=2927583 RepID=A0ABS9Y5R1_9ACTN|nr:hypothetical protein [Streptomyces cylindrosporus]MCI3272562.1 hypothetical protein [Streptomyces cylindrosporus]
MRMPRLLERALKLPAAPALRLPAVRAGFAALPVLSLGLLCPVPSLVLALRRRARADWLAFGGFSAVFVAWLTELALTPDDTHGALFGVDLLLITLSMAGAAAHAWTAWPRRAEGRADGSADGSVEGRARRWIRGRAGAPALAAAGERVGGARDAVGAGRTGLEELAGDAGHTGADQVVGPATERVEE